MKWMQAHALLRCSTVVAWRPSSYDALGGRNRVVASGYGNTRRPLTPGHQPADKNSAMSDSSSSSSSSSSHNFNKYYDPSTSFDFEAAAEYKPSTVPGKLRVVCVSDTHGFENRLGYVFPLLSASMCPKIVRSFGHTNLIRNVIPHLSFFFSSLCFLSCNCQQADP